MKFLNFLLIIFITLSSPIKADSKKNLINKLKEGNKLIFIRHAYAPGRGDPVNFTIDDCLTQRNLSNIGRLQAKEIGIFFKKNNILFKSVFSSEWCRCKETALIAFKSFETKIFLNSFFSKNFIKKKKYQVKNLKDFVKKNKDDQNLIFVTHYVVIEEVLDYTASSGEIVISNRDFKVIDTFKIKY